MVDGLVLTLVDQERWRGRRSIFLSHPFLALVPRSTARMLGDHPMDAVMVTKALLKEIIDRPATYLPPKQGHDCKQEYVKDCARVSHRLPSTCIATWNGVSSPCRPIGSWAGQYVSWSEIIVAPQAA